MELLAFNCISHIYIIATYFIFIYIISSWFCFSGKPWLKENKESRTLPGTSNPNFRNTYSIRLIQHSTVHFTFEKVCVESATSCIFPQLGHITCTVAQSPTTTGALALGFTCCCPLPCHLNKVSYIFILHWTHKLHSQGCPQHPTQAYQHRPHSLDCSV